MTDLSLASLVTLIINVHHVYARTAIRRITTLVDEVMRDAAQHRELTRVAELFKTLQRELEPHMRSEEGTLFPAILQMANPQCAQERRESLRLAVAVMQHDHGAVDRTMRDFERLRRGTRYLGRERSSPHPLQGGRGSRGRPARAPPHGE